MNRQTRAMYKLGMSVVKTVGQNIASGGANPVSFKSFPKGSQSSGRKSAWKGMNNKRNSFGND